MSSSSVTARRARALLLSPISHLPSQYSGHASGLAFSSS
jgi:hypothetical protein